MNVFSQLFFTSFLHSFFDFLHFGHIHVFCEEGVKMWFFRFWLFSAVFLCGRFQYDVKNRWNSNVFVFPTVFVWTIPVLWYTNKRYFCNFCVCATLEVSPTDGKPFQRVALNRQGFLGGLTTK